MLSIYSRDPPLKAVFTEFWKECMISHAVSVAFYSYIQLKSKSTLWSGLIGKFAVIAARDIAYSLGISLSQETIKKKLYESALSPGIYKMQI